MSNCMELRRGLFKKDGLIVVDGLNTKMGYICSIM